ncbi:MAG: PEGA domain-containing protein [Fimbriimonadales bacterium]|nr:PEGA domain-containing protein [Fimbriimonadales bacterium]
MKRKTGVAVIGLVALFALSLLACSGGGGGGTSTFSLAVTGTPSSARVYLNGQLVENPQRITLPPGTHTIRVETTLSNGQVVAQQFTIVAGAVGSIQYDLSRYQIETNPATIEVWAGEAITVAASLRDVHTNAIVSADFIWSVRDTTKATVQKLTSNSARLTGVSRGATRLVITDARTGVTFEVPVSVLDFPPPPN